MVLTRRSAGRPFRSRHPAPLPPSPSDPAADSSVTVTAALPIRPTSPSARACAAARVAALTLALSLVLGACGEGTSEETSSPGTDPAPGGAGGLGGGGDPGDGGSTSNDSLTLRVAEPAAPLREGEGALELTLSIERAAGYDEPLTLSAESTEAGGLLARFADEDLEAGESGTTLTITLPIGPLPRLPGTRELTISLTDPSGARLEREIAVETLPTERPDIYLLAGQSNMVGSSREGARRAGPGEPDAPNPRILELDVTPNDAERFPTPASYTDLDAIAVADDRIVEALDPLHDPRDPGNDDKSVTTIGLGLSFAKAALADTTADIVLVPSAWSDTGFCVRETNRFRGSGWNAETPRSTAFAGTLLHDRAIARTDLAIAETGGILRGILWHQGEADSDSLECANAYEANLRNMVASLRTNIAEDARGPAARGADADIPFVLGTMSMGDDERGPAMAPFGPIKSIVDTAHRNVSSIVPLSAVAVADDLTPANGFPCGQGFCIHFGAEALRELGNRYYERLRSVGETR